MVRIYRWNIDKNICDEKIKEMIINAIKKNDNIIILNKLVDIVNNNKTLDLKNDNKKRTVTNYLKSNHKGILNFLKSMDEIVVYEKERYIYVHYNDKSNIFHELDDWLYINKENIEK